MWCSPHGLASKVVTEPARGQPRDVSQVPVDVREEVVVAVTAHLHPPVGAGAGPATPVVLDSQVQGECNAPSGPPGAAAQVGFLVVGVEDPVEQADLPQHRRTREQSGALDVCVLQGPGSPGLRPWKWCSGLDLIRGFVPASGLVPAWKDGHRLIFEVSSLEGDQHDDRT